MKISIGLALIAVVLIVIMMPSNQGTIRKYHNDHVERARSSVNPPAAKTGAPGETNCTSCHLGTTQSADGVITVTFSGAGDEYIVNQAYTITISIATGTKNGFEMTILDDSNLKAGTFTAGTGTSIANSGGKQYIRQNVSVGMQSWSFTWTAPATDVGDLTMYYAFNKSNAAGNTGGDVIYLGQYNLTSAEFNTVTDYEKTNETYTAYYHSVDQQVKFGYELDKDSRVVLSLQDLSGRLIKQVDLGKQPAGVYNEQTQLEDEPIRGIYIVSLFVDNNVYNRKIVIH
jgi:hypothetical protein